jgi:hypothetical protein
MIGEMNIGDKVILSRDMGYSDKSCRIIRVVDELHENGSLTAMGGKWKGIDTCITLPWWHFDKV